MLSELHLTHYICICIEIRLIKDASHQSRNVYAHFTNQSEVLSGLSSRMMNRKGIDEDDFLYLEFFGMVVLIDVL